MKWLCYFVISVVVLSATGEKAAACSLALPSVVEAAGAADIVAIVVVDSIQSDYVVLTPEVVLKGDVVGHLILRRYEPSLGMCEDGISRQPYSVGDRLIVMLPEAGERADEMPAYAPMRMHLPYGHPEAEQTMLAYLKYVVENGIDPIEIRSHGKQEYLMGEKVIIDVSVTNRLKVPITTSMDSSLVSDLLSVEFVVNGLGFDSPASHSGLRIVPAETTVEMTVVLQDYFGELRESHLLFISFLQFPVNRSGKAFAERMRGEARHEFSVSTETNVENQGWGKVKGLSH